MSKEEFMTDRRTAIGINVAIGVLFAVVLVVALGGLSQLLDHKTEGDKERDIRRKFESERYILKICNDGTRIYNWNGQTMTKWREPILPEACN